MTGTGPAPARTVQALGVAGLPEVRPGDDLVAVLAPALRGLLHEGDVVAVASKVVAKAEGRLRAAADRDGAVADETVRVVAERRTPRGTTRVVRSRSGPVMAAAGVDASNVPPGHVLLLPVDCDASARALRAGLRRALGVHRLGVLVTDTFGRPWREGQGDVALGAAGVRVVDDLRGARDAHGTALEVTERAVADEMAALADLAKGKLAGVPVALLRGVDDLLLDDDGPGAARLDRGEAGDWFRYGHAEAARAALGVPPGAVEPAHVVPEPSAVRWRRAVQVAGHGLPDDDLDLVSFDVADGRCRIAPGDPDPRALVVCGLLAQRLAVALWAEDLPVTVHVDATGATVRDAG